MNIENTNRIIAVCPSLFRDIRAFNSDNTTVPLQLEFGLETRIQTFGFECGDGWADLLVELCSKIQDYFLTIPEEVVENIRAVQVKEKFGTLRFYLNSYNETLEGLIEDARIKSSSTCEVCGDPGEVIGDSWLRCVCKKHSR